MEPKQNPYASETAIDPPDFVVQTECGKHKYLRIHIDTDHCDLCLFEETQTYAWETVARRYNQATTQYIISTVVLFITVVWAVWNLLAARYGW